MQAIERVRVNQTGIGCNDSFKWDHVFETLLEPKTYLWISMSLLLNVGASVVNVFGPIILNSFGFTEYRTPLLNIPFAYYLLAFLFGGNPLIVAWIVGHAAGMTKKSVVMSLYNAGSSAGNIIGPLLFNRRDAAYLATGAAFRHYLEARADQRLASRNYEQLANFEPISIKYVHMLTECSLESQVRTIAAYHRGRLESTEIRITITRADPFSGERVGNTEGPQKMKIWR
ncbi:allantoin permease [Coccidioides immitis RMSCC 3703]|uniref:Allantoin permease n=1 Tax=Coccidioides immitis RMSCC 3703 TaxID=454286 RepID=A0A0J8QSL6_COCIT|nr:allantoin permease [Coccidioides immitis RMSCC 3703]